MAFRDPDTEDDLHLYLERFSPPATQAILATTDKDPQELFPELARQAWTIQRDMTDRIAEVQERLHTDDFPILEFRWAHGIEQVTILDSPLVGQ